MEAIDRALYSFSSFPASNSHKICQICTLALLESLLKLLNIIQETSARFGKNLTEPAFSAKVARRYDSETLTRKKF